MDEKVQFRLVLVGFALCVAMSLAILIIFHEDFTSPITHQCGTNNVVKSAIDTCGVFYNTTSPITECHQYCTTSLLEGTQGYCSCMAGCI